MRRPLRLGVLGSGKGSNFRALMEQINDGRLDAEVRIVISDVEDAGILSLARNFQIPGLYVRPGRFRAKLEPEVEEDVVRLLREASVELVILAGFMRIAKQPLVAGETVTGCTVHYVEAGIDTGEILGQRTVPILPDDTPERLHARIQKAEHVLLPAVVTDIAAGFRG